MLAAATKAKPPAAWALPERLCAKKLDKYKRLVDKKQFVSIINGEKITVQFLLPLNKWEGIDIWVLLVRFCMFSPVCWPDY